MGGRPERPEDVHANRERIAADRQLVERLLAGDEQAYDELFTEHFAGLFRFALSRLGGDEELAREMVQQTLVTAFEKLASFRGDSTLFSWLCGICRFTLGDHLKRRKRRGEGLSLEGGAAGPVVRALEASQARPDERLEGLERARRVHQALDELPSRQGLALEWKYLQGESVREIARRLDVGEKAAESLLTRARGAFRVAFERLSGRHPPGSPGKPAAKRRGR